MSTRPRPTRPPAVASAWCHRWPGVGSALDNAAAEAFNSTIKVEYIHWQRFTTRRQGRVRISTWIVDFYNQRRRHSACDGMSPNDYKHFTAEAGKANAA